MKRILDGLSATRKLAGNGLMGNAREKGLLDKPGVPIVCGNSSGNMGDRNRTNWLTVGHQEPSVYGLLCDFCVPSVCRVSSETRTRLQCRLRSDHPMVLVWWIAFRARA